MLNRFRTDAAVVKRVLRGHTNDFGLLVDRYSRTVHAVSLAQTRNFADAEDIAQQSFIKAFQSLDTLKEPAKFGAWICTIARNLSFSQLRKKRDEVSVAEVAEGKLPSNTPDPASDEMRELLRGEIEELETKAREVLLLYYFGDQRLPRVAELLDISEEAAKKRLQRARAALSERLEERIGDIFSDAETKKRNSATMAVIAATTPAWKPGIYAAFLTKASTATACAVLIGASILTYRAMTPEAEQLPQQVVATQPIVESNDASTNSAAPESQSAAEAAPATAENPIPESSPTPNDLPFNVVAGTVTDPDGNPVSGATVWANRSHYATPRIPIETTTDETGAFRLELDAGKWYVRARTDDLYGHVEGDDYGRIVIATDRFVSFQEIALEPAGSVTGQLLDELTEASIPHAKLWLDQGIEIEADATGRFYYAGLPQGQHVIAAVTPGYQHRQFLYNTAVNPDVQIVLRTSPGATLHGRVIDEHGNPVPNAFVGNLPNGNSIILQSTFAQTESDGSFALDGLTFGKPMRIMAEADGFQRSAYYWTTLYQGLESEPITIVLEREKTLSVSQADPGDIDLRYLGGTVSDEVGNPLADVDVRWMSEDRYTYSQPSTTNEYGVFEILEAQAREGIVLAVKKGYVPLLEPVGPVSLNNLGLTLEKGETFHGKVVDRDGNPIAGAQLEGRIDESRKRSLIFYNARFHTDENGEFVFEGYDPETMTIDIRKSGYSRIYKRRMQPERETNTVRMTASGALFGTVLLPDGSPAPEFTIYLKPGYSFSGGGVLATQIELGTFFSGDDGRFVISQHIDAGQPYHIIASAPGYRDANQERVNAGTIMEVENQDGITLQLSESSRFEARIARANDPGMPIPHAQGVLIDLAYKNVFAHPGYEINSRRTVYRSSDDFGIINFASVPFESATLLVRAPGFATELHPWEGSISTLDILMEPESRVVGIVTNGQGEPLTDGEVRLTILHGVDLTQRTLFHEDFTSISPGHIDLRGLPAGECNLTVKSGDDVLVAIDFTLGIGEELNINDLP